jgi:ribbon-helix-helix CopG family protein
VAVLRSRSRLVTFRLDPEEYAALRRVCITTGARSMSEFAREAVLSSVEAGGQSKASLGGDLVTLTNRLHELDRMLRAASGLIGKVLGGEDGPGPNAQDGGGSN